MSRFGKLLGVLMVLGAVLGASGCVAVEKDSGGSKRTQGSETVYR